jgi:hypothetical protein
MPDFECLELGIGLGVCASGHQLPSRFWQYSRETDFSTFDLTNGALASCPARLSAAAAAAALASSCAAIGTAGDGVFGWGLGC